MVSYAACYQGIGAGKNTQNLPGDEGGRALNKDVAAIIRAIAGRKRQGKRFIVAIAGAPGAGKSTLAEALCRALNSAKDTCAGVLPMDGFHLDNALLKSRGMLEFKGAPRTFDIDGFGAVLKRIRRGDRDVIVPVFDRVPDMARAGGRLISASTEIIIVEGNYLFPDRPEWVQLAGDFDLSVFPDVPLLTLEQRLAQWWLDHGMGPEAAVKRALGNDIPNAKLVSLTSRPVDIRLQPSGYDPDRKKEVVKC